MPTQTDLPPPHQQAFLLDPASVSRLFGNSRLVAALCGQSERSQEPQLRLLRLSVSRRKVETKELQGSWPALWDCGVGLAQQRAAMLARRREYIIST